MEQIQVGYRNLKVTEIFGILSMHDGLCYINGMWDSSASSIIVVSYRHLSYRMANSVYQDDGLYVFVTE